MLNCIIMILKTCNASCQQKVRANARKKSIISVSNSLCRLPWRSSILLLSIADLYLSLSLPWSTRRRPTDARQHREEIARHLFSHRLPILFNEFIKVRAIRSNIGLLFPIMRLSLLAFLFEVRLRFRRVRVLFMYVR